MAVSQACPWCGCDVVAGSFIELGYRWSEHVAVCSLNPVNQEDD